MKQLDDPYFSAFLTPKNDEQVLLYSLVEAAGHDCTRHVNKVDKDGIMSPCMYVLVDEDTLIVADVGELFTSDVEEIRPMLLNVMLMQSKAIAYCLVSEAWMLRLKGSKLPGHRVSEDDRRENVIMLQGETKTGEYLTCIYILTSKREVDLSMPVEVITGNHYAKADTFIGGAMSNLFNLKPTPNEDTDND